MNLNVFIVKYSSMSGTLVERGALSILDRASWFLDGLPEQLCDRALEYCAKKDWRLSADDTGSKKPSFDELKEFVSTKARAVRMKEVYEKERAAREAGGLPMRGTVRAVTMRGLTRGGVTTASIPNARVADEPTRNTIRPENCGGYKTD
jgi:hypothetical protein